MNSLSLNNPANHAKTVMILAGEASGDLHGGALACALLRNNQDLRLVGFGGDDMRAAGVDIRFDVKQLGIVGLIEVIYHFRVVLAAYRTAVNLLKEGVDLIVLIDFPDFNLRVAKAAKKMGIPVIFYVSPQLWAWRPGRIHGIAKRIDQMLVILPFEKALYEEVNVPCEFVGHPLMDELDRLGITPSSEFNSNVTVSDNSETISSHDRKKTEAARSYLKQVDLDPEAVTIGLLPGSRKREVLTLLPDMLQGVELLKQSFPNVQVLIPVAPTLPADLITELCRESSFPIRRVKGNVYPVLRAADVSVLASGTATLQGALAGEPIIIAYKVSKMTYIIGKCLINLKVIGLANIVAEKPFIPELIQNEVSPANICRELSRFISDETARDKMKQGLREVAHRLGKAGASERAAAVVFKWLDRLDKQEDKSSHASLS